MRNKYSRKFPYDGAAGGCLLNMIARFAKEGREMLPNNPTLFTSPQIVCQGVWLSKVVVALYA